MERGRNVFGVLVTVTFILIFIIGIPFYLKAKDLKKDETDVLNFVSEHPDKCSLYLIENDETVIDYHSEKLMPLASSVKIIVAVEFSKQVADGRLDPNQMISLSELDKFYIPRTDGGAHDKWLQSLGDNVVDGHVSLYDVARGMIQFSSNANTEFLIDLLGVDNINARMKLLGIVDHSDIYYFTSSFLLPAAMKHEKKLSNAETIHLINSMDREQYGSYCKKIHQQLRDERDQLLNHLEKHLHNPKFERIISDRLPASTAKEYALLMNKIHSESILSGEGLSVLRHLLESHSYRSDKILRIGAKGGSTRYVATIALYAERVDNHRYALAFFVHDPDGVEITWVQQKFSLFVKKLLEDRQFKAKVQSQLVSPFHLPY